MVTQIPFASFPNPILKSTVKHKHLVSKVVSENLFCFSKIHGNANSVLHQEKKMCLHITVCQHMAAVKYFLLPMKENTST